MSAYAGFRICQNVSGGIAILAGVLYLCAAVDAIRCGSGVSTAYKIIYMSRARYGDTITAQRGRFNTGVGGVVYSLNGGKRAYVTPSNPQTASQGGTRGAFAFFTTAWKNLTEEQRGAWTAAWSSGQWQVQDAISGTARNFGSAKSLFIALNMNVLVAGNNLGTPTINLLVPQAKGSPAAVSVDSVVFDASAGTVVLTFSGTQATGLLVRCTEPVSPGNLRLTSVKSKLRTITSVVGASPASLGTDYVAVHGAITGATGQKVFWTIEQISDITGQRSFVASGSSVIAA